MDNIESVIMWILWFAIIYVIVISMNMRIEFTVNEVTVTTLIGLLGGYILSGNYTEDKVMRGAGALGGSVAGNFVGAQLRRLYN